MMRQEDLIPGGYYDAVAVPVVIEGGSETLAQWGEASTGTQQILLHFYILDAGEWTGTVLPWFGSFTKDAYQRTLDSLRYCGWVGDDTANLGLLDQRVSVTVEHKESTKKAGNWFAQVAWVNRYGSGRASFAKAMSKDQIIHMAARLKVAARAVPVVPGERVDRKALSARSSGRTQPPAQSAPAPAPAAAAPAAANPFVDRSEAQPPRGDDWGPSEPTNDDIPF